MTRRPTPHRAAPPHAGPGASPAPDARSAGYSRDACDPEVPVVVPIEDAIDLHAFAPRDIPAVVEDYVEAAHAAGFAEVRIVHGRGIGVQRAAVRRVLACHPLVVDFHDAPPERGGHGATIARLGPRGGA